VYLPREGWSTFDGARTHRMSIQHRTAAYRSRSAPGSRPADRRGDDCPTCDACSHHRRATASAIIIRASHAQASWPNQESVPDSTDRRLEVLDADLRLSPRPHDVRRRGGLVWSRDHPAASGKDPERAHHSSHLPNGPARRNGSSVPLRERRDPWARGGVHQQLHALGAMAPHRIRALHLCDGRWGASHRPWMARIGTAAAASPDEAPSPELSAAIDEPLQEYRYWTDYVVVTLLIFDMIVKPFS
jgi:hypothetical protein